MRENKSTEVALIVSGVLTILQLASKLFSVISESKALKEESLVYLMSKMTSSSKWIPFQQPILRKELKNCINFGKI